MKTDNTMRTQKQDSLIRNWVFSQDEPEEMSLAEAMADVAEKNGMSINDLQHLFPAVLRMLQSDTSWTK